MAAWQLGLGFVGTVLVGWLAYLGAKKTAGAARESVNRTAQVDEQQSALDAWKELLEPYRGQRARVVLLLEHGGLYTQRRAPRMAPRSIAAM